MASPHMASPCDFPDTHRHTDETYSKELSEIQAVVLCASFYVPDPPCTEARQRKLSHVRVYVDVPNIVRPRDPVSTVWKQGWFVSQQVACARSGLSETCKTLLLFVGGVPTSVHSCTTAHLVSSGRSIRGGPC